MPRCSMLGESKKMGKSLGILVLAVSAVYIFSSHACTGFIHTEEGHGGSVMRLVDDGWTCACPKKSNSPIPIFIPNRNSLTFLRNIVQKLECFTDNIYVVDLGSTYPPLLEYYENEYRHFLIHETSCKDGPFCIYSHPAVPKSGRFIITDPDIDLNPNLPCDFIEIMDEMALEWNAYKVGFALDRRDINESILHRSGVTIHEREDRFWQDRVMSEEYEVYRAAVDTTFSLTDMNLLPSGHQCIESDTTCLRIAGNFTARHLPWLGNFLPDDERRHYYSPQNTYSHY